MILERRANFKAFSRNTETQSDQLLEQSYLGQRPTTDPTRTCRDTTSDTGCSAIAAGNRDHEAPFRDALRKNRSSAATATVQEICAKPYGVGASTVTDSEQQAEMARHKTFRHEFHFP